MSKGFPRHLVYAGASRLHHLLLLPHDLQFLCELNLPLSLGLLGRATQFLPVLVSQGVESSPGIAHLS